jgi:hypothetical protein
VHLPIQRQPLNTLLLEAAALAFKEPLVLVAVVQVDIEQHQDLLLLLVLQ